MKTICILSYERAGTTWLCTALNTSQTWCVFELFSRNPALYYWNFLTLLKKRGDISPIIVETFQKIFHPQNLFVDVVSFNKIKKNMLSSKPFTMDLLESFKQEAYLQNKNFCFKIFPEHFDDHIKFNDVINSSDYIVINYRNNILETFLSWKLALKTGAWTSLDKKDESLQDAKIIWNENHYLLFYEKTKNIIDNWKNLLKEKNPILFQYEEIHSHNSNEEKALFIKNKFENAGLENFQVSSSNKFSKQIDYLDKSSIIANIKDYEDSINKNIPIYYISGV